MAAHNGNATNSTYSILIGVKIMAVSPGTVSSSQRAVINFATEYYFTSFQKTMFGVLSDVGAIIAPPDFARAEAGDVIRVPQYSNVQGGFVGDLDGGGFAGGRAGHGGFIGGTVGGISRGSLCGLAGGGGE